VRARIYVWANTDTNADTDTPERYEIRVSVRCTCCLPGGVKRKTAAPTKKKTKQRRRGQRKNVHKRRLITLYRVLSCAINCGQCLLIFRLIFPPFSQLTPLPKWRCRQRSAILLDPIRSDSIRIECLGAGWQPTTCRADYIVSFY